MEGRGSFSFTLPNSSAPSLTKVAHLWFLATFNLLVCDPVQLKLKIPQHDFYIWKMSWKWHSVAEGIC